MSTEEKTPLKARWWEEPSDDSEAIPPNWEIDLAAEYDGEVFYINGLRDGHYLEISLKELARAIVAGG